MKDEHLFYVSAFIVFILTWWLGWYAIIPVIVLSLCFCLYNYIDDVKKDKELRKMEISHKRLTIGEALLFSIVLSAVGSIIIGVSMLFKSCVNDDGPKYDKIERRTKIHTIDGDKMPTMSEHGEYHNAGTGERQIEYGGSIEQKRDIEAADRLIESGH